MKPVRLQMAGLRSWQREEEVNFSDVDLAAVVGSTGAGKSSILEGIVYSLFNATTYDGRNVASLISSDAPTVRVTFDFDADGERWRVTRSTSRKSYPPSVHKLSCLSNPSDHPMVEGEAAVNAAIKSLIGLTVEQFTTAVVLPQGRFQRLLTATPGERTGILKGVFRLDELASLRERASELRRDVVDPALTEALDSRAQLLLNPQATLDQATTDLEEAAKLVDGLRICQERHQGAQQRTNDLAKEVEAAQTQASALTKSADDVPALDPVIEAAKKLDAEEAAKTTARDEQLRQRDELQRQLDAAAEKGETAATLAQAKQVLHEAVERLPQLDEGDAALARKQKAHERQLAELTTDREQLARGLKALEGAREELAALATAKTDASERLVEARAALAEARSAAKRAEEAHAAAEDVGKAAKAAETAADEAATQAAQDRTAADEAEAAVKASEREHHLAAVAHDLHSGEPCPICHRDLPPGFDPPEAPVALKTAQAEASRTRAQAEKSAEVAVRAKEQARTKADAVGTKNTEAEAAERAAATSRDVANALLGDVDLADSDDALLAGIATAAEAASDAHEKANTALIDQDATLRATQSRHDERDEELRQQGEALTEQGQRAASDRERILEALAALPPVAKPASTTPAALGKALAKCAQHLEQLERWTRELRSARETCEAVDRELAELETQRRDQVDTPRRHAAGFARDIVVLLRALPKPPRIPAQPGDAAALTAQVEWVQKVVDLARGSAAKLEAAAEAQKGEIAKAEQEAAEALSDADRLVDEEVTTIRELDSVLNDARARMRIAEAEVEKATDHLPKAAALDTRIEALRARRESLEELCRLLADGQFVSWLVARRQQTLLVVASEILAGITDQRYRFDGDFNIVDARTGTARNPKTLSGGETFLASLALALGMAELAARSGGRIGSLYLDEGFGSLDPNTLDEAINALEERARAGQMIVVISHVPTVAQRIERVLQVTPDPTGSTARWLDDADREAMLTAAAAADVGGAV